jgi:hypothetical protein
MYSLTYFIKYNDNHCTNFEIYMRILTYPPHVKGEVFSQRKAGYLCLALL